jgi:hypothetical protein
MKQKGHAKFNTIGSSENLAGLLESEHAGAVLDNSASYTVQSSTFHLVRGFTRARGRIFSLDFTFDNLGLILPNGNAILQSVSAR